MRKCILPGTRARVCSSSLTTIDGRECEILCATTLNANEVPGYVVLVDGKRWTLYADEVCALDVPQGDRSDP